MRVIIAGAGEIGTQLLRDLSETGSNEVVVVESDERIAESLAEDFDALVIHGDAANPDILGQAQVEQADALIAVTGSDAINTVIAMLGHRLRVERIVVKLASNSLRGALEEIGVSDVVAPTMAAAARIKAALHGDDQAEVAELAQGRLQLGQVAIGREASGRRLDDFDVSGDVLLVSVIKGGEASLARGSTTVEEGDVVMLVAESEEALESCRAVLRGGDGGHGKP